jgi:hypothetical protein
MAEQLSEGSGLRINADLYRRQLVELDKHTRNKDSNVAKMRGVRKELKQDGVNMAAFNLVRGLAKFEDDDRLLILEEARRLAGWEGLTMPVSWRPGDNENPQGGMFEDEGTPESRKTLQDNRIAMDAWNSRKAGGARENNPHPAASEDNQTWDAGWRKADKEFAKSVPIKKAKAEAPPPGDGDKPGGPQHEPEVQAAKRGRGRPPKAKTAIDHLEAARKRLDGDGEGAET